jgi:hypothetical protein
LCVEINNKVLPITAKNVNQVFGIPTSGQKLHDYKASDKRAVRAKLRKICDEKNLQAMFRRRQLCHLWINEVLRWFIEHYVNVKEADVDDWTVSHF